MTVKKRREQCVLCTKSSHHRNSHIAQCGHRYCWLCVERLLRDGNCDEDACTMPRCCTLHTSAAAQPSNGHGPSARRLKADKTAAFWRNLDTQWDQPLLQGPRRASLLCAHIACRLGRTDVTGSWRNILCCPRCITVFCAPCGGRVHPVYSCPALNSDKDVIQHIERLGRTFCPSCGVAVELARGFNEQGERCLSGNSCLGMKYTTYSLAANRCRSCFPWGLDLSRRNCHDVEYASTEIALDNAVPDATTFDGPAKKSGWARALPARPKRISDSTETCFRPCKTVARAHEE